MFSPNLEADHPFGAELAQVEELAEEIVANEATMLDEEEQYLVDNGLRKFSANDYLDEIQGYSEAGPFASSYSPFNCPWI